MATMFATSRFSAAVLSIVALAATACEPTGPKRAASDAVVADVADKGAVWPLLLQHCLRSPACDPMSDFGEGAGEASNSVGSVAWFAQVREKVGEGGEDYGAKAELSLFGTRGVGGKAGRPLTIDELPDNLGGARAKRSTLTIDYRAPSDVLEPYGLQVISPFLTGVPAGLDEAKLEIVGAEGVLFSATAGGMAAAETPVNGGYKAPGAMVFFASQNIRDEPVPKLMAALTKGESLSLRLKSADGETLLQGALYADGYAAALEQASAALNDAGIGKPIVERCAPLMNKDDAFWRVANIVPASLVCDPRLPDQRR
ncbi:MAG: hypothetical protein ABMA14_11535 [Hyphomonadaceae bacterium]